MKYILYTTSGSKWYQQQANIAAKAWSRTKGRGEVSIKVKRVRVEKPVIFRDQDGDKMISWDWLNTNFDKGDYDGVFFHFTPHYRRKWGISKHINGSKNTRNKDYPEFWVCCGKESSSYVGKVMINGELITLSNFLRLLFHEMAHFDEDLDDTTTNKLRQNSVHNFDYVMKGIHTYHLFVDYRGYILKQKVNRLLTKIIKLTQNVFSTSKTVPPTDQ